MQELESSYQKKYYEQTAKDYNALHVNEKDEHYLSLSILDGLLDFYEIKSVLDVGSGTGRAIAYLKSSKPNLGICGIEPVKELRGIGYSNGLLKTELIDGNALDLPFRDGEFDLVCAFGVLHHIKNPEIAVSEMMRVASKAVFISDANNFGQGSRMSRLIKRVLYRLRLWKLADLIKTKGKGYTISEGDGLAYSYSVFSNYNQIARQCERVHLFNTIGDGVNFFNDVSHMALLGLKKRHSMQKT